MRYFFFLLSLMIACTNNIEDNKNEALPDIVPTTLLLFLKEQTIEYWADHTLVKTQNITNTINLPIGYFKLYNNTHLIPQLKIYNQDSTHLYFPDDLLSSYPRSFEVFIFPNDARSKVQFDSCTRCPYQIAELYSTLWLYLQTFKKDNNESN